MLNFTDMELKSKSGAPPNTLSIDAIFVSNTDPFQDAGIYTQEELLDASSKKAHAVDQFLSEVLEVKQVNVRQLQDQL